MAYADTGRSATATLETLCTLIEGIFASTYGLTWNAGGTPTYGGLSSLTFTSVTTNYSKYIQVGKWVIWILNCSGTTGGTNGNALTVSAPITAKSAQTVGGGCLVYVGSGSPRGGFFTIDSTTGLTAYVYDASNYGLGTLRGVLGVFIYEAA